MSNLAQKCSKNHFINLSDYELLEIMEQMNVYDLVMMSRVCLRFWLCANDVMSRSPGMRSAHITIDETLSLRHHIQKLQSPPTICIFFAYRILSEFPRDAIEHLEALLRSQLPANIAFMLSDNKYVQYGPEVHPVGPPFQPILYNALCILGSFPEAQSTAFSITFPIIQRHFIRDPLSDQYEEDFVTDQFHPGHSLDDVLADSNFDVHHDWKVSWLVLRLSPDFDPIPILPFYLPLPLTPYPNPYIP